jgi:hypothetical protein
VIRKKGESQFGRCIGKVHETQVHPAVALAEVIKMLTSFFFLFCGTRKNSELLGH